MPPDDAPGESRFDVAVAAGLLLVRALTPGEKVRTHFVARCAEGGLVSENDQAVEQQQGGDGHADSDDHSLVRTRGLGVQCDRLVSRVAGIREALGRR
jgi:hypothetical protein